MKASPEQASTTTPTRKRRGCLFYLMCVMLGIVFAIVAPIILGFIYETIMQAGDAERYPAPGQLSDVDGYTMHIHCVGEITGGSPTVILETGAGGFSAQQTPYQEALREDTRVCVYDRAGMGWSEPRPETRTAWQITHELHTLLQNADIQPPYVLVGPSNGGLYVRAFAAEYPDEVDGLILLDPTFEQGLAETQGIPIEAYVFFGRIGAFRLFAQTMCPTCTPEGAATMGAFRGRAATWETYGAEWAALQQADEIATMTERLGQPGTLGDTAMIIISANQSGMSLVTAPDAYRESLVTEIEAMQSLTTNYRSSIVDSDHGLSDQQPLILQSIRDVIEASRSGEPLPALG